MNKIITVGREFGSGGREFGRRLAENLGIAYYDKEIITKIAEDSSLSEEYIKSVVECRTQALFPITVGHTFACINDYQLKQMQVIYSSQNKIIKDLADKSSCVIVGRCADYILKELKPLRIFVYADMQSKIERCLSRADAAEGISEKEMKKQIISIDRARAEYYENYTGQKWGDKSAYDLCINTSNADIKKTAEFIAKLFI